MSDILERLAHCIAGNVTPEDRDAITLEACAEIARLRLTDEELENIDLAIQQLPYGAARVKVVLYEIMQRYGFQRDRSGGTQGR